MSDKAGFDPSIETRDVASGFEGIVNHDDGTATKVWAPTEEAAREKAQRLVVDDE